MTLTFWGEHFTPLPMRNEVAYYILLIPAAVYILRNLYLAVRAPWEPESPRAVRPPRSRITSKYLSRAGATCILTGILLVLTYFYLPA